MEHLWAVSYRRRTVNRGKIGAAAMHATIARRDEMLLIERNQQSKRTLEMRHGAQQGSVR